ncbi:MAG: methyltransferase domain-containing protein [Rhodocyclaceae bacterium]|nr:methyltransferase domain-containing protein [Rhodocyclaceae bacterium]
MKLSIGSGDRHHPGWTRLDIDPACSPDILADITQPLPLPDDSVELILCEEVVTQIPLEDCAAFLKECARVLAPGGAVRVLMPNLRKFLKAYFEDPQWLIDTWKNHVGLPLTLETPGEVINRGFRLVGPFMYDLETFTAIAEPAGFEVREVTFGESQRPEFRGLDLRKPDESASIYLELWPR